MKLKLLTICAIGTITLSACSSTPTVNGVKFEKDETLSTAGDKSMPDWAEQGELQPFAIKDGKVYSVGITTIRGDERPEAALRMAESNSRAAIAKNIENRMEFIFQGSEENYGFDSVQAKYVGSEVSSITGHSFSMAGHWWKRYVQTQEDGSRKIFYKVYALSTMAEADLKQAIYQAIHKGEGEHKLGANFQEQVDRQWNRFVEGGKDQPTPTAHKPASVDAKPTDSTASHSEE